MMDMMGVASSGAEAYVTAKGMGDLTALEGSMTKIGIGGKSESGIIDAGQTTSDILNDNMSLNINASQNSIGFGESGVDIWA